MMRPSPRVRKRIIDHDGDAGMGGIEKWLQLAQAARLERDYVIRGHAILPGVRYAVEANPGARRRRVCL
jgi:pyrroloquinoline quinone (PQQ) biosynthesis protein C